MTQFHAVMLDETGCEFGASVEAPNREEAFDTLREDYPESQVLQLESPSDRQEREERIRRSVELEIFGEELDEDDYCQFCDAPLGDDWNCPEGCEP